MSDQNPHPPGSMKAAGWDLDQAVQQLGTVTLEAFSRDLARVAGAGISAREQMRRWRRRFQLDDAELTRDDGSTMEDA